MATEKQGQFSLKVMKIKETYKVLYAEVDSDFADVLLSFLTLPLGTIVRLLIKSYGDNVPILGSLNSLYGSLQNLDDSHFWTKAGKLMLLNPRRIQCSGLKLHIDDTDTPPIQCFVCWNGTCVSMYNHAKCPCPNSTTTMTKRELEIEPQSGEICVFTAPKASFLLTDDLQILTNTPASLLRILKLNGIEDTNVLKERTLIVGRKEIMELLKGSLVSKTPLTDMFLGISLVDAPNKRKRLSTSAICEPNALPCARTSQYDRSNSKKIYIKVLVQNSTNKILLAQTRKDLIDFLFSLLTIPLGRVQLLLGNNRCHPCIDNLYKSISNLEIGEPVKSRETITTLLKPELPPYHLSSCQIFSLDQQSPPELYRLNKSNRVKLFVSTPIDIWHKMKMIDPKGKDCFIKGPTTFMVTDDLVVSTPSSASMISILNQLKIPLSDVEERHLYIGMKGALSILEASLISTCALTEGLKSILKKQPK